MSPANLRSNPVPTLTKTILAAGFLVLLAACSPGVGGSGHVIKETRALATATSILLGGAGELTIVQGEPESLQVEAEDNIMPLIRTKVDGGLLEIGEKGSVTPTKPIRFLLTVKTLNKIISEGAGTVRCANFSVPGPLDFRVEGAGTVDLAQLECASINVVLSGAGDVKLGGHTRDQNVEISGSGKYQAGDLRTHSAKVRISGAGDARLWVTNDLEAEISGVGSVDYFGSPSIKKDISGVGSLHALGEKAAPAQ